MIKVEEFIKLVKIDNLVDLYNDELEYPSYKNQRENIVLVRKELAEKLIDDSYVINEMYKFIGDYIRQIVEISIEVLLKEIYKSINIKSIRTKALSAEDYIIFNEIFNQELKTFAHHNEPRLWGILGVGYGQGMQVGLGDLGLTPEETNWQLFRETAAYRQAAFANLEHITNDLGHHIKGVVAAGVTEGVHPYEIARRLRELKLNPKKVIVPPKIVNGKEVRKGYSYFIDSKRYSEMIARTEASRAINQGRLDAYRRTRIKQVEWLTAGDDRVCDNCMDLDGRKFPIDNAPLIPLHTSCRCTYIPAGEITSTSEAKTALALSVVDEFSRTHFNNKSILPKQEFEEEIKKAVKDYKELSTIERKKILRDIVTKFKRVGSVPIIDAKNTEDIIRAYQISKNIAKVDSKILAKIREAVGEKQNYIFIGEDAFLNKSYVVKNDFTSGVYPIFRRKVIKENVYVADVGGCTFPAFSKNNEKLFVEGRTRNISYIGSYKKLLKGDKLSNEVQQGHVIFHELGHTIYSNILLDEKRNLFEFHFKLKSDYITSYAEWGAEENFTETFGAYATGSYKIKDVVDKNFIIDLIK